jgi:hypothetical protein
MTQNEKIIEEFDKKFVKDLGNNVESVFLDANGSVGPVKQFILFALEQKDKEWKKIIDKNTERHEKDKELYYEMGKNDWKNTISKNVYL